MDDALFVQAIKSISYITLAAIGSMTIVNVVAVLARTTGMPTLRCGLTFVSTFAIGAWISN
jgi:hypothetical protein